MAIQKKKTKKPKHQKNPTKPETIPTHGQTLLAGRGGRKSRINTIKQARQTAQLCVTFEMQSPEAEEAAWLTRANFEIPQRQVA